MKNGRATPLRHGTPMNPSFAHYRFAPQAVLLVFALGACASLPPPTSELAAAQQAVSRADAADADQYAGDAIARARAELAQAQAAMAKGRDNEAREFALATAADADLAYALSSAATTRAEYEQRRAEIVELQQRLQLQGEAPAGSPLDVVPPPTGDNAEASRLQALEADPGLNGFAAYERLRAHQALDTAMAIRSAKLRDAALQKADRRIAIAELAARTEATRREIDRLDRQRSELLVEASRQEADRARQEAERMRVQAQIQAEEAQRLRLAAESEAAARQQAEDVILDVGGEEAAKLKAARERDAELARQEAELMAAGSAGATAGTEKPKSKAKPKRSRP
jgi:hypothetical protein